MVKYYLFSRKEDSKMDGSMTHYNNIQFVISHKCGHGLCEREKLVLEKKRYRN